MYHCEYYGIAVVVTVALALLALFCLSFAIYAYHNFHEILYFYRSISQFAADPGSFAHRMLFAGCFIVAYMLIGLYCLELSTQDVSTFSDTALVTGICGASLLPLVGFFHTDGANRVERFRLDMRCRASIPVGFSTAIHTVSSFAFFLVFMVLGWVDYNAMLRDRTHHHNTEVIFLCANLLTSSALAIFLFCQLYFLLKECPSKELNKDRDKRVEVASFRKKLMRSQVVKRSLKQ